MRPPLSTSASRLGAALAELGGSAEPGAVGLLAGYSGSAQAKGIGQLRDAGLVDGPKHRVELTHAGWALFASSTPPTGAGDALDVAGAVWGTGAYAHRAFLELIASAIVGRHHLGPRRPDAPHLVAIAIGDVRTGKSAIGAQLCHLFGLSLSAHQRMLRTMAPGELFGRRSQTSTGVWTFAPAPTLQRPFVLLDEYDKAPQDTRRDADRLMQGDYSAEIEGTPVEIRPTVLVAANPPQEGDRLRQIQPAYQRRAVLLDTAYAASQLADLGQRLRAYFENNEPAALRLEALRPPADRLPPSALAVLELISRCLTERGRSLLPDERALEIATLGRAALLGYSDDETLLQVAAFAVMANYLQVSETTPGQVEPGWYLDVDRLRVNVGPGIDLAFLERALTEGRRGREAAGQAVAAARVQREVTDLELVTLRANWADYLRQVIADLDARKIPKGHKPTAAGLRAALGRLRDDVANCKDRGRLAQLQEAAGPSLAAAAELLRGIEADRLAVEQDKRTHADEDKQEKRRAAAEKTMRQEQVTAARANARAQLVELRQLMRPLESMYGRKATKTGEQPLRQLAAVHIPGVGRLLVYEPPAEPEPEPPAAGFGARVRRALTSRPTMYGTWRCALDDRVNFPGWPGHCQRLTTWGPDTRAVLAPALSQMQTLEDQLAASLRQRPRTARPAVAWSPPRQAITGSQW
jgi:hypothetical protein